MDATVPRLPVRLLDSSSHGWRDLSVNAGGGGAPAGQRAMRFDGASYPRNPTADGIDRIADDAGTLLIAEDARAMPLP